MSRRLDSARTETALAWIGKLYAVEKDLHECCRGEWEPLADCAIRIAAERQARSRPLWDGFHAWLEVVALKVLPKSPVRKAMNDTTPETRQGKGATAQTSGVSAPSPQQQPHGAGK